MEQNKIAAFFDVDGTLVDTDIRDYYFYFVDKTKSPFEKAIRRALFYGVSGPYFLFLEKRGNRVKLNKKLYAHYKDLTAKETRGLAKKCYEEFILPQHFPEGYAKVRFHQSQGHHVVFVTGSIDILCSQ